MIYLPEEVEAARVWAENEKRTGAEARRALIAMGCGDFHGRARDQLRAADFWAKRILKATEETNR